MRSNNFGFFTSVFSLVLFLVGCNSDGTLDQSVVTAVNKVVTVTCQIDSMVPGAVSVGSAIAVTIDPASAPIVAGLSQAEQLVHPVIVAACAAYNAKPTAVAVTTVPPKN